jgi:hypothetical protein
VLRVDNGEAEVLTGIGGFGWSRKFPWSEVSSAREILQPGGKGGGSFRIALDGRTRRVLGLGLNSERRYFFLAALQQMLREGSGSFALHK